MAAFPRLCVAASSSGAGKTSVTLGLLRALSRRGLAVRPFKVGPDYIDPGLHALACGSPSHNLDSRLMDREAILSIFSARASGADLAVIEGVMGYFDGDGSGRGSTAELAAMLRTPVVLLLDLRASAESAAAVALGFVRYRRPSRIAGFILNRTAGGKHYESAKAAVERATGLPVFGCLPKDTKASLPERHLGLVSGGENPAFEGAVDALADALELNCDLDALLAAARRAPPLPPGPPLPWLRASQGRGASEAGPQPLIAVARDEAFSFYYEDNLNALRDLGATLAFFSPLHDGELPEGSDGLYLGGGYPELYARALSENVAMRASIRSAAASGLPIFAECGGYLYLTERFRTGNGEELPMAGVVPGTAIMTGGIVALGYHEAETLAESFVPAGTLLDGHCYHWSHVEGADASRAAITLAKPGKAAEPDGFASPSLFASYLHMHFAGQPGFARAFADACRGYARSRRGEEA